MSKQWMLSAAAAMLIASAGMAQAQNSPAAPRSGGEKIEHGNTEGRTGVPMQPKAAPGHQTVGQAGDSRKAPGDEAEPNTMAPSKQPGRTGENAPMQRSNGMAKDDRAPGKTNMNAEEQGHRDQMKRNDMKAEQRDQRSTTTGQAGAHAKLSSEQRTRMTTVFHAHHVRPVEHVNFSISVGTRVPHSVSFHALPAEIVTIYPGWRGYEYFMVPGQIVVVDPATFEIVAVLPA